MSAVLPSLSPELVAGQRAALGHGVQLGPDDLLVADPGADAAVGAGLDVLPAHHAGVVDQALSDPSASLTSPQTFHSCACRTLPASTEYAWALIFSSRSAMSFRSMSDTCGRWPLPQQTWKRIWSSGRPASAWLMISTQNSRYFRYCSTV